MVLGGERGGGADRPIIPNKRPQTPSMSRARGGSGTADVGEGLATIIKIYPLSSRCGKANHSDHLIGGGGCRFVKLGTV